MATGLQKTLTVIGLEPEVTEGTYVAPSAATSYIQPLQDGFEMAPSRELLQRDILSPNIGKATPKLGMKAVTAALPVEFRASGTEGGYPDFDQLLEGALGASRQVTSRFTTGSSHTTSVLNGTAVSSTFAVGDLIVILDSGDHTVHFCTAVTSTTLTYSPVRSSAPADAVEVAKLTTYYVANSGHPALSLSYYWANQIREAALGCKVTSMSVDNFSTGQLASLNFGLEGLTYTQVDGAAPHTPTFDSGTPPVILNACVYQDGTSIDINNFSLSLTNTLGPITATCDANGKTALRVTDREITGSINPYKDDTSVANFTNFNAGTPFSLIVTAYTPSSTTGEISLGSVVGIYLPSCFTSELTVADQEGILTDAITFQATTGSAGDTAELFIGMC